MHPNDIINLANFINENHKAGQLSQETIKQIEALWNRYKVPALTKDYPVSIIEADFGVLGSIVIRGVKSYDRDVTFKYDSGNYNFISIKSSYDRRILWTDYSDEQPYNRQGGLYCGGMNWHVLEFVKDTGTYREFQYINDDIHFNTSFAVWGFMNNEFYGSVRFGMCIKTEDVNEFVSGIRHLIGKP